MRKGHLLFSGAIAATVVLSGVKSYADDAYDIEAFFPVNQYAQYDNTWGYDPNGYPVITDIASQPGYNANADHTYSNWSILAQDQTGSLELFLNQTTLAGLAANNPNTDTSPMVGDGINTAGQYDLFNAVPMINFSTVPANNNYLTLESTGNAVPAPPVFTVSQLNIYTSTFPENIAGYYLEIQNVTITGNNGQTVFPNFAQATVNGEAAEFFTITDATGSMGWLDWVTAYSTAGNLGGTAVPSGPVNIFGFVSIDPGVPGFSLTSFVAVPEPSPFVLAGMGLAGLLAIRRRRC